MVNSGLESLADWILEPVFWYGIVAPVALLVIATLYLFWLDHKAARLYRLEVKQKSAQARRKPSRKKIPLARKNHPTAEATNSLRAKRRE